MHHSARAANALFEALNQLFCFSAEVLMHTPPFILLKSELLAHVNRALEGYLALIVAIIITLCCPFLLFVVVPV
jgi:hypothetical protein